MNIARVLIAVLLLSSLLGSFFPQNIAHSAPHIESGFSISSARAAIRAARSEAGSIATNFTAKVAKRGNNWIVQLERPEAFGSLVSNFSFTCHYHGSEMACHSLASRHTQNSALHFYTEEQLLLAATVDSPQAGSGTPTNFEEEWDYTWYGLAAAGTIYAAGLAHQAWQRYWHSGGDDTGSAPNFDPPPGSPSSGGLRASSTNHHHEAPSRTELARYREQMDIALQNLFIEAEAIGASLRPHDSDLAPNADRTLPPRERNFSFDRGGAALRLDRTQISRLLLRVAEANLRVSESAAACAHCDNPFNRGAIAPNTRPRSRFTAEAVIAANPNASSNHNHPETVGLLSPEQMHALQAAQLEAGEISVSTRANFLNWLKVAATTPIAMLYRRAPEATLNFLAEPRDQGTLALGAASRIIAERGWIPGSLLLVGLPPWLLFFETFLDPFHVWCHMGATIYFGAANTALFMGSTIIDGTRYRDGDMSFRERLKLATEIIALRRKVDRYRKLLVLPTLAAGLNQGIERNSYFARNHSALALLPPWIRELAQGHLWADVAALAGTNASTRLRTNAEDISSIFSINALENPALFTQDLERVFSINSTLSAEERAFRWREMIDGLRSLRTLISQSLDAEAYERHLGFSDYARTQWWQGEVAALIQKVEMIGLIRLAEGPAAWELNSSIEFEAAYLERIFIVMQNTNRWARTRINALAGQAPTSEADIAQRNGIGNELRLLKGELRSHLSYLNNRSNDSATRFEASSIAASAHSLRTRLAAYPWQTALIPRCEEIASGAKMIKLIR